MKIEFHCIRILFGFYSDVTKILIGILEECFWASLRKIYGTTGNTKGNSKIVLGM